MSKIFIVAVALFAAFILLQNDDAAMSQCQQTHSFDTCFHSLNR
jgi:hypothetical protein